MTRYLMKILGRFAVLYRPEYLESLVTQSNGAVIPCYRLGDLRVKIFGVRVPFFFGYDCLLLAREGKT